MIEGFSQFDSSGNLKIAGVAGATGATGSTGATGADGTTFRDRHFGWTFRNANGTQVLHGANAVTESSTNQTVSNVQDSRNSWRRFVSTSVASNPVTMNISPNEGLTYVDHGPYWASRIRMGSDLTSLRVFFGWTNCITNTSTPRSFDNANTQTTAGLRVVAFRYVNGTDTGFLPMTWDGASQTSVTAIGTVTVSTEYLLEIQLNAGGTSATFYVTQAGSARVSTTLAIGSACNNANNSLNALVPYGFQAFTTANSVVRTIDHAGVYWDAAGRSD